MPTLVAPGQRRAYTVRKASELMGMWGTCLAIYGPTGAGKSTLAAQAADSEWGAPVGVIDAEGGARAYGDRDDITVFSVKDSDERHDNGMGFEAINQILDDLIAYKLMPDRPRKDGQMRWGTIVVDNCSEINAFCTYDTIRTVPRQIARTDRPDQKDWNTTTSRMLLLFRRFRDFAQASGTNVILLAWDRQQEDKVTGVNKKDLAFNPALSNQMPGLLDAVGYLTIKGKGVRALTFEASLVTAAKFRRTATEIAMTIPSEFQYEFGSPHKPMRDIIDCLKGGKAFPKQNYKLLQGVVRGDRQPDNGPATTDVAGQIKG